MADTNASIGFSLELIDNCSAVVDKITNSQAGLDSQAKTTQKSIDSQNLSFVAQYTAVRAVGMGFSMMTSSLLTLGIVAEKDTKTIQQMNAGIHLVVASFGMMKGAVAIINQIKTSSVGLLGVESALAVLRNPMMMGVVITAVGVGAGVAGYAMGASNTKTITQTINYGTPLSSDQRDTARGTLQAIGG